MENSIIEQLGKMDIYLIDQLMKGRIAASDSILDAGYGRGRNLAYFVRNKYNIYGIDHNPEYKKVVLDQIEKWDPSFDASRIKTGGLDLLPYDGDSFDFIFSIAVLHFAKSNEHYLAMLDEMMRVLKPNGYLMFRMTSWHTFELLPKNESGIIEIKDGERYMLDIDHLKDYVTKKNYRFADPIKTTNVDSHRTMTTIVIQK